MASERLKRRDLSALSFITKSISKKSLIKIGIKQGKMGTEMSKIALNAHIHLRTANQH